MAESATSVGSLTFFGLFAMFSLSPLLRVPREALPSRKPQPSHTAIERFQRDHRPHLACPLHPQTSYWLGDANEMLAINTILIIVNAAGLSSPCRQVGVPFRRKRRRTCGSFCKGSINHFRDWLARPPRPESSGPGGF